MFVSEFDTTGACCCISQYVQISFNIAITTYSKELLSV